MDKFLKFCSFYVQSTRSVEKLLVSLLIVTKA